MEKYSAFRDPGTGIQPFLTPIPPNTPALFAKALLPFGYIIGSLRIVLVLLVTALYIFLDTCLKVVYPIAPLHGILSSAVTAVLARLVLLIIGLWWIPVTNSSRKRGRSAFARERWNPRAGDVIVSNWSSWIEILWLGFRFNPVFTLPAGTPRRLGASSTATSRSQPVNSPEIGFRVVSLLEMIRCTGHAPPFGDLQTAPRSLESIRKNSRRPVVVFPECTTSNGRAMLRFADVFGRSTIPVKDFNIFIICVRYDPPTHFIPALTCSIPSSLANPFAHIFRVASSTSPFLPQALSIRLLNPAESPSSKDFLASDIPISEGNNDQLAETCSILIAQLGRLKVTGQSWVDKVAFLHFRKDKMGR